MSVKRRTLITSLSVLLVATGIVTVLALNSNPLIEFYDKNDVKTNVISPGDPITFRIYFYLVDTDDPTLPESPVNDFLTKIVVNTIYVTDPNGKEYQHDPIVIDPGVTGGTKAIYVEVDFGPGASGWNIDPDTSIMGTYLVDFPGTFYCPNPDPNALQHRSFNVPGEFVVPEASAIISLATCVLGLALFYSRNRLAPKLKI